MQNNRVLHITLKKCGSQWVRDVLIAPELLPYSNRPYAGVSVDIDGMTKLDVPEQTFGGPIYNMTMQDWEQWRKPNDQAIVVLRDPRDRLVSNLFSILFSHRPDTHVNLTRKIIHRFNSLHEQLEFMMFQMSYGTTVRMYNSWAGQQTSSALVLTYEELIQNQYIAFRKITDWLGWKVPEDVLQGVIQRLSFEKKTGRRPGEVDKFSHLRSGTANDWQHYFNRSLGQLWESLFPGLLRKSGYEQSDDWWQSLNEQVLSDVNNNAKDSQEELIYALETRLKHHQTELDEKEKVIHGLVAANNELLNSNQIGILTKVCEERLALVERLHAEAQQLRVYIEELEGRLYGSDNGQ